MSTLFQTPKIPKAPAPAAMPDQEDMKARMAKRAAMMDAQKRKGRDSTILTPGTAADYQGTTLGGSPR